MIPGGEVIGGSVASISFNGTQFSCVADNDQSHKLGGFEVEVMANGDGSVRQRMIRVPFNLGGIQVAIDNSLAHHEFLQSLADAKNFADVVIQLVDGSRWSGRGKPIGEITKSTDSSTATFDVAGQPPFTQQT